MNVKGRNQYKGKKFFTDEVVKRERERQRKRDEARAAKNADGLMTNASFAATNEEFRNACEQAGIKPTARQASKYRRKLGLAYEANRQIQAAARVAAGEVK